MRSYVTPTMPCLVPVLTDTPQRDSLDSKLPIWGGKDCDGATWTPAHGEKLKIGNIEVTALHTPCHTQDSICWYMKDGDQKVVFTGDTLFIGGEFLSCAIIHTSLDCSDDVGCGRFFEGTAEQMHKALNVVLASLPDDTLVYVSSFLLHPARVWARSNAPQPGHEYTKSNVAFALSVSQSEAVKKLGAYMEAHEQSQGKFTIGDEKVWQSPIFPSLEQVLGLLTSWKYRSTTYS